MSRNQTHLLHWNSHKALPFHLQRKKSRSHENSKCPWSLVSDFFSNQWKSKDLKKKYTSGLLVRRGLLGAVRVKLIEVYLVAIMGLRPIVYSDSDDPDRVCWMTMPHRIKPRPHFHISTLRRRKGVNFNPSFTIDSRPYCGVGSLILILSKTNVSTNFPGFIRHT